VLILFAGSSHGMERMGHAREGYQSRKDNDLNRKKRIGELIGKSGKEFGKILEVSLASSP